jgi:hypothetical protein
MPEEMEDLSWRGKLTIYADWASPMARYLRQIMSVLVRETGF